MRLLLTAAATALALLPACTQAEDPVVAANRDELRAWTATLPTARAAFATDYEYVIAFAAEDLTGGTGAMEVDMRMAGKLSWDGGKKYRLDADLRIDAEGSGEAAAELGGMDGLRGQGSMVCDGATVLFAGDIDLGAMAPPGQSARMEGSAYMSATYMEQAMDLYSRLFAEADLPFMPESVSGADLLHPQSWAHLLEDMEVRGVQRADGKVNVSLAMPRDAVEDVMDTVAEMEDGQAPPPAELVSLMEEVFERMLLECTFDEASGFPEKLMLELDMKEVQMGDDPNKYSVSVKYGVVFTGAQLDPSFDAGHFRVVAPRGSTDLDPMAGLILQMMEQSIQEMEDSGDFAF